MRRTCREPYLTNGLGARQPFDGVVLAGVLASVLGWLIIRRQQGNRIGLLLVGFGALPSRSGLAECEMEVLRPVAAGRGNRDIASELPISPRTASVYVSDILAKLGVSTRTEAAATVHQIHVLDGQ